MNDKRTVRICGDRYLQDEDLENWGELQRTETFSEYVTGRRFVSEDPEDPKDALWDIDITRVPVVGTSPMPPDQLRIAMWATQVTVTGR